MAGLKRKFFLVCYNVIGKRLPSTCSKIKIGQKAIRRFLVRGFACSVGEGVNIDSMAFVPVKLYIGRDSGIGRRAFIQGETHIGDYVMMGPECNIWTVNHETSDVTVPMSRQGNQKERPVYIGNDVWIGSRVTILPGVRIGNGVIIGAGAVVAKDIPDYAVAVGNPARVVKFRNRSGENGAPGSDNTDNKAN